MPTWSTKPADAYLAELRAESPRTRRQAAAALEILGDRRAIEPLLGLLSDEHTGVRANAARALGKLGDELVPGLVEALIRVLHAPEGKVRACAAAALWNIGGEDAIEALSVMHEDPHGNVVHFANQARMAKFGPGFVLDDIQRRHEERKLSH